MNDLRSAALDDPSGQQPLVLGDPRLLQRRYAPCGNFPRDPTLVNLPARQCVLCIGREFVASPYGWGLQRGAE
jgi:hypothetical protein